MAQLDICIRELKAILYGLEEAEPVADACAQVTQEFFTDDTMRLLIICLPQLNFEVSSFIYSLPIWAQLVTGTTLLCASIMEICFYVGS